jgi:hypothetical protein
MQKSPLVYVDDVNILAGSVQTINKTEAFVVDTKKIELEVNSVTTSTW